MSIENFNEHTTTWSMAAKRTGDDQRRLRPGIEEEKNTQDSPIVRTWGAALLCPYRENPGEGLRRLFMRFVVVGFGLGLVLIIGIIGLGVFCRLCLF